MPAQSKILVITGMHRSGTSLVAAILQHAGLDIGNSLLPANELNPRGFNEDIDFYQFHQKTLYRCHEPTPYVNSDFSYLPLEAEFEEARQLIQKRSQYRQWGWKDPRTCLFLDFWHQLLPNAHYLFVYRHPLEVLFSFIRRNEIYTIDLLEALNSWYVYNARILAFYQEHSDNCLLGHTYSLLSQPDKFRELLKNKFGLELEIDRQAVDSQYHPAELRKIPLTADFLSILGKIHPASTTLYDQLNKLAALTDTKDLPSEQTGDISFLIKFVNSMSKPLSPAQRRSALLLLVEFIEPGLIDKYYETHNQQIVQLFKEQGQLESLKDWVQKQNSHIQQIEAELATVYNSRTWRLGRRLADSAIGKMIRKMAELRPNH